MRRPWRGSDTGKELDVRLVGLIQARRQRGRPPSFWRATGYLRWLNSLLALALQEKGLRDDRESDRGGDTQLGQRRTEDLGTE
ncbi:unnamed protein product [Rangifer tarandus platyrhynchus]|uniref:Uncharacterized protein n=1 Tax=Rangifer tarandus platyrhynchus TaxID=3082113 RepID=A0ABN8Y2L7_RANTA|nr:unnamed protein product [Rangifer tarandus platyrhynchus]